MSAWDPRGVLEAKRDGRAVPPGDIRRLVLGYVQGEIPDEVAAAFLMAACIRGLDATETEAMTAAMVDSGTTLSLRAVGRPTVDKHSTGGVGDGVTLVFAPLAASLGLGVAKLSGRGLGHTGGTLDKLESIPGFRTDLSPQALERQVAEIGCAVAAQSAGLVPADGMLYALRDATATVPSIPLIAASVMAKKFAVESDLVLLDVKMGSGAFMRTPEDAVRLAETCVALGRARGRVVRAAVTDMSQPLGDAIGNALDVAEAVRVLRGQERGGLRELATTFAAEAAARLLGMPAEDALRRAEAALDGGEALGVFRAMVGAQGGDPGVVDDPEAVLPRAPVRIPLPAPASGIVVAVDAEGLGRTSADLGAGRHRKGDPVDPAVGLVVRARIGDAVERGEPIGEVHARDPEAAAAAATRASRCFTIGDGASPPPLVLGWFGAPDQAP